MHPGEAIKAFEQKMAGGAAVYLAQGQIVDEDGAIYWVDEQGLYARVTLETDPHRGAEVTVAIAGWLFDASNGGLHSRPIRRGEHLLIALVEGDPRGHCVAISRVHTADSKPVSTVAFADVTEESIQTTSFDNFAPGESWHVRLKGADLIVRIEDSGELVFSLPGGAVFCFVEGGGWKLRAPNGNLLQVTNDGVQMRASTSFIDVTTSGVTIKSMGPVNINGQMVALNMEGGSVASCGVLHVPPLPTGFPTPAVGTPIPISKSVFVGG